MVAADVVQLTVPDSVGMAQALPVNEFPTVPFVNVLPPSLMTLLPATVLKSWLFVPVAVAVVFRKWYLHPLALLKNSTLVAPVTEGIINWSFTKCILAAAPHRTRANCVPVTLAFKKLSPLLFQVMACEMVTSAPPVVSDE
jgi:hypothetical protein